MISALAIALPIVVIVFAGKLMVEVSGRDRIVESKSPPVPKALQSRPFGYDASEAEKYWDALDADGRAAELRLLRIDLLFPVLYGTALAFSIITLWSAIDIRIRLAWFVIPAIGAIVADWIETGILLELVKNFVPGDRVDSSRIKIASVATIIKSASIALSAILIISLAILLLVRGVGSGSDGVRA